jgi:branched-chain amino acid transport system permease protein
MEVLARTLINGVLLGGVYALIVLGVVVVAKATKVINLAYGGILLLSVYFFWWLVESKDLAWPIALLLMVVFDVVLGILIDRFFMRPLVGRREAEMISFIGTVIMGAFILVGFVYLFFGAVPHTMPKILPSGNLVLGSISVSYSSICAAAVGLLMFIVFSLYFRYSKNGLAMRCVAEDAALSQGLGINVRRIFLYAWIVATLSAGVAGILLGSMYALSDLGNFAMTRALPVLLLAGLTSLPGAFTGALLVGLTECLCATYVDPHVVGFREVVPYVMILVVLLALPNGLFQKKPVVRI